MKGGLSIFEAGLSTFDVVVEYQIHGWRELAVMNKWEFYTPFMASSRLCSSVSLSKDGEDGWNDRLLVLLEIQFRSIIEQGLDCELDQDVNSRPGSSLRQNMVILQ